MNEGGAFCVTAVTLRRPERSWDAQKEHSLGPRAVLDEHDAKFEASPDLEGKKDLFKDHLLLHLQFLGNDAERRKF